MNRTRTKGLGRGLDTLLGRDPAPSAAETHGVGQGITELPLDALVAGRYQPRTRMDESALQELAASIRSHGLMQPIVVRPVESGRWEIIAGERRTRAARIAGLETVPVVVRKVADKDALALALIENIQREDLNPLEEAQAIQRLITEFSFTHEQAAESIGRSRSATTNLLRLLQLAEPVQTMLLAGDLEMGHARALLPLAPARQTMLAAEIHARRMSVRDAERLAARHLAEGDTNASEHALSRRPIKGGKVSRDVARIEEKIADLLATRVQVKQGARGSGTLTVHFTNPEHFEALMARLSLDQALED
jgi:ParB family chromosome partitioning protein